MRLRGKVQLRHRIVEEERLAIANVALDEGDAAFGRFAIDRAPRLHVERPDISRRFAEPAFPDERGIRLLVALRDRGVRFVAGAWDAPELVEALVGGLPSSFRAIAAEMPLTEECGRVPSRFQCLGNRDLPQRDATRLRCARSNRVASGHQRRSRHRAGKLDVEVVESDPFSGELVETRRDVAAHAAIRADLAPPEVVGKDQDDIRANGLGRDLRAGRRIERPGEYGGGHDPESCSVDKQAAPGACQLAAAEVALSTENDEDCYNQCLPRATGVMKGGTHEEVCPCDPGGAVRLQ